LKKTSKTLLIAFIIIAVTGLLFFILNNYAETRIKSELEQIVNKFDGSYEDLDVNLLFGNAGAKKVQFDLKKFRIEASSIELKNFSYFNYFFDDKIEVGEILIKDPLVIIKEKEGEEGQEDSKGQEDFKEDVLVNVVKIENAKIRAEDNTSKDNKFHTAISKLVIRNIRLNPETVQNKLPFEFESYMMKGDSLFLNMNPQHDMSMQKFEIDNGETLLEAIKIIPRYDRQEFQEHIPYEKDHIQLTVNKMSFDDIQWNFTNDSLKIENEFMEISGANLQVYRDKLQPDDTRIKPMYSKVIRELPFKLKLDTINITQVNITYEELLDEEREPGEIKFEQLGVSIYNLTNIGMQKEDFPITEIKVNTRFMGETSLKVNWVFDISNRADVFSISGSMDAIKSAEMNEFFQPGLNIKAEGEIEAVDFNFTGNVNEAKGDMYLEYKDFKVEVLRSDGTRKDTLLSAVANFFINKDAQDEEIENKGIEVERDKTKSFWNYLWRCVRNGALEAFL